MKLVTYAERLSAMTQGIALLHEGEMLALPAGERQRLDVDLLTLIRAGLPALRDAQAVLRQYGRPLEEGTITYLPPVTRPPKIVCVGLNYLDHTEESNFKQPDYPTLFGRFTSSMTGHLQPIVRPLCSEQLDFEGEMVVFIGRGGRHIARKNALEHVIGYSICNDASVRDVQFRTPQWTMGKNFDDTGTIGPCFVSADELPAGGAGLRIETRLNGQVVQSANTRDMVFDVATLIEILSEAMTLSPGDVIVSGTPAGVGFARKPPLWMKASDTVEVEIEGVGLLRNPIVDEGTAIHSPGVDTARLEEDIRPIAPVNR